ncbi:MAG: radical SAM family heme chaperone HemW [bacterium]|nr:radical SAM family heme chaperone HemW [bacterium]
MNSLINLEIPPSILNIINPTNNLGIYIHYPFCIKECFYCDFYKTTSFDNGFYRNLLDQLSIFKYDLINTGYRFDKVGTIYFGGGTPSLMSLSFVERILESIYENFETLKNIEISFEINPDLSETYLRDLKKLGINRISIGVQSFSTFGLRIMGRIHTPSQIFRTINNIQKFFDNYNIDMLCLYPYQTIESLKQDLKTIVSIASPHVSYYLMDIDKKSIYPLILLRKIQKQYEISDHFYNTICDILSEHYEHYEVSNFARNGLYCKHNLKYWYYFDYIGFGPSAVSKLTINNEVLRVHGSNIKDYETINYADQLREKFMLALRTKWGIIVNGKLLKLKNFQNYNTKILENLAIYNL